MAMAEQSTVLTNAQERFWRRRGHLILKGVFTSSDVAKIRAWSAFEASPQNRVQLRELLEVALVPTIDELLGEASVFLSAGLRRAFAVPIQRDAWRFEGMGEASISGMIALSTINGGTDAPFLYPGSQAFNRSDPAIGGSKQPEGLDDIAGDVRDAKTPNVALSCAAGDVWLRDSALIHGCNGRQVDDDAWKALNFTFVDAALLPHDQVPARIVGASASSARLIGANG